MTEPLIFKIGDTTIEIAANELCDGGPLPILNTVFLRLDDERGQDAFFDNEDGSKFSLGKGLTARDPVDSSRWQLQTSLVHESADHSGYIVGNVLSTSEFGPGGTVVRISHSYTANNAAQEARIAEYRFLKVTFVWLRGDQFVRDLRLVREAVH